MPPVRVGHRRAGSRRPPHQPRQAVRYLTATPQTSHVTAARARVHGRWSRYVDGTAAGRGHHSNAVCPSHPRRAACAHRLNAVCRNHRRNSACSHWERPRRQLVPCRYRHLRAACHRHRHRRRRHVACPYRPSRSVSPQHWRNASCRRLSQTGRLLDQNPSPGLHRRYSDAGLRDLRTFRRHPYDLQASRALPAAVEKVGNPKRAVADTRSLAGHTREKAMGPP